MGKTINFTKVTQEDVQRKWHLRRSEDMEKDDLGRARRKWMSSGCGHQHSVWREEGRGLYQHMRRHLSLHSLLPLIIMVSIYLRRWVAPTLLPFLHQSTISFANVYIFDGLQMLSPLMYISKVYIAIRFFRILFSRSSHCFILSTLKWSLSFYLSVC